MERPTAAPLRIGDWLVNPASGEISRNGDSVRRDGNSATRLDERSLRLLLSLAGRPGEVVSIENLLSQVWSDVAVTPDSVYQAVATLRRQLGDDPKQPVYIATVPRLGYRLVAPVSAGDSLAGAHSHYPTHDAVHPASKVWLHNPRRKSALLWAAAALFCIAVLVLAFGFHKKLASATPEGAVAAVPLPNQSIAVLPFLDLTEHMKEEEFADGMTEELIDRLSKVPGLRVPPPTSSFYFKGKQVPIAEIARTLRVNYVLDGSIRKSGPRVRVAARLVRADNAYVIWSESYDRPFKDILAVQDDIAGEVTRAIRVSTPLGR